VNIYFSKFFGKDVPAGNWYHCNRKTVSSTKCKGRPISSINIIFMVPEPLKKGIYYLIDVNSLYLFTIKSFQEKIAQSNIVNEDRKNINYMQINHQYSNFIGKAL
jgi:hypothetical protein